MKKARKHACLTLCVIILLLTCSCSSMQSFEAGLKTPSWFPLEVLVKVRMKVDGEVAPPGDVETEEGTEVDDSDGDDEGIECEDEVEVVDE